jgi:uncharacterized protein (TIGR02646 family)
VRRVIKFQEPSSFSEWKGLKNDDWSPTYETLQNPEKRELHASLVREQGFTCCYCGREIDLDNSHIEHFRPQSRRRDLELDYQNLFASCLKETPKGTPLICGHLKDEEFDESTFLSPILPAIEAHFSYTLAGDVRGQSDPGRTMVRVLGLNHSFLTSRRSQALQGAFSDALLDDLTSRELERIAAAFRTPSETGRLEPFFHVVARFAEDLVASCGPTTAALGEEQQDARNEAPEEAESNAVRVEPRRLSWWERLWNR